MADPISGSSRPIQSPSIDQTQKTKDSESVKAASDRPYAEAQQQQQALQINSSRSDLQDMMAQLRETVRQRITQGQAQHQPPHGLKGLLAKAAHKLHGHHGLMTLFSKHHHGGPPAMHGLDQALARSIGKLPRAPEGPLGQKEIPTPGPKLQPAAGDVPLESLQPRPNVMEAAGQEPVLAPAGNAPPPELPAELQGPSDDPAVKEIQQAMMDFQQKWGDFSVKDNPDGLDEYNTDVANLSKQIAQFYSSMSSEFRS